jgi:hypothetical protein
MQECAVKSNKVSISIFKITIDNEIENWAIVASCNGCPDRHEDRTN